MKDEGEALGHVSQIGGLAPDKKIQHQIGRLMCGAMRSGVMGNGAAWWGGVVRQRSGRRCAAAW